MNTGDPAPAATDPDVRLMRLLGLSAIVGVLAAAAAVLFVGLNHWLQHVFWEELPHRFGWEEPAGWWVMALLLLGALVVWLGLRMPGRGGHRPLDGMKLNIGPAEVGSVVVAALGSLAFGAVLGPEAPLIAIGTAVATVWARGALPFEANTLLAAGAMAAMGFIFGNPLITAILVLEFFVLRGSVGGRTAVVELLPVMTALGFGYLLQVGFTRYWDGLGEAVLSVPGLPPYPSVLIQDVLVSVILALVVAGLVTVSFRIGLWYMVRALARPLPALLAAAVLLGVTALLVRWITGEPIETVLFSGHGFIGGTLAIGSITTLLLIAVAKTLVYGVSLGAGYRGGPVFPAVYIGVALGTATALIVDESSLSAYVAAGIAAGAAASLRLPFTSVLLAVLLCAASGFAITSIAIVAAAVGILTRAAIDAAIEGRSVTEVDPIEDPELAED